MQKNKWNQYKLKDLVNINASSVSKHDNLSCILYLDTGSVTAGKIKELLEVSYNNAPSRAKRKVKNSSIVYSMVRPNQLHYGLIKNPSKNMIVSTGFAVIDCYEERANSKFIYYWLTQSCITNFLQAIAENSTSAYPAIRPEDLENLDISLPPLDEQKRIAEILGAFDDKIELLQKQNKTLEDMAKALFKSWFVDFDVVRAKAALATRRNLSPLRGKCHNVAKGGPNKPNSSCALVSTHQIYAKSVKNLVRAMRQNLTPQEVKLWQYLRKEQMGVKFRRQFPIDSKYIADFACLEKKLIIELDGTQHAENQHDKERTLYLEDNGFTVMRFWNNEIDKNLIGCLERIRELLNYPPLPAYGVLSPQGGQKKAQGSISSPDRSEFLQEQGEQIADEADIMREYHLTEELYDLFPSSFADSPLGPIPSGWEVKPLSKIATFLNGLALQKYPARAEEDFLPVIKIAELRNGISTSTDKANTNLPTEYIVHNGDILFSWSGSLMVKVWSGEKGALNQHLFKVFSNGYPKWFYYLWVNHYLPMFQEIAADKATTMGHIQRKHLDQAKVVCPSAAFLDKMDKIFGVILSKIILNNKQIQTLTELRDTLLPRLISGKIRV